MYYQSRGRHRNMYYLTGLPGFMRFGYSPGWIGRSPTGLGPCAQYLAQSGQLTNVIKDFTDGTQPTYELATPSPKQKLQFLKASYETMKSQLEILRKEIEELESNIKGD